VKTSAFSDILLHLGDFFGLCQDLGLHAEAEGGPFRVYRSRIGQLNGEIDRLRAGEAEMPVYRKLAADLPRYLVALAESGEIVDLLPFLRSRPPRELVPRMRLLLAGPELPSERKIRHPTKLVTFSSSCGSLGRFGELGCK